MSAGELGEAPPPPFRGFRSYADDTPRVGDEDRFYEPVGETEPEDRDYRFASDQLVLRPPTDEPPTRSHALAGTAGIAAVVVLAAVAGFALTRGLRVLEPEPAAAPRADAPRTAIPSAAPHAPPTQALQAPATRKVQDVTPAPPSAPAPAAHLTLTPNPLPRFVDRQASSDASVSVSTPAGIAPPPAQSEVAVRPSFDCRRAETPAQQMVCDDPRLAAADRRMSQAYAAALAAGFPADQLQAEQGDWLEIREDAAHYSSRAVLSIYRQRIRELEAVVDDPPE